MNVLGHIMSFKFPRLHALLDQVNVYIFFVAFLLTLAVDLHLKRCTHHVSEAVTGSLVVLLSIALLVSTTIVVCHNRRKLVAFEAKVKRQASDLMEHSMHVHS